MAEIIAAGFLVDRKCDRCEGSQLHVPDAPTEHSYLTCVKCSARTVTWGAYKANALEAAANTFGGRRTTNAFRF